MQLARLEREGQRAGEVLALRLVPVQSVQELESGRLRAPVQERPVQERPVQEPPVPPEPAPSAERQRP